jgi:hypothetical protein
MNLMSNDLRSLSGNDSLAHVVILDSLNQESQHAVPSATWLSWSASEKAWTQE